MDANPRRMFLTQQIEANMAEHGQSFVSMAESHARFIFPKRQIKDPMHTVFNSPVASHRVGKGFHRGETEQKVAGFSGDLVLDASFGAHHANPSQAFPSQLWIKIGQDLRVTDGPVVPDLQTPMRFAGRYGLTHTRREQMPLAPPGEKSLSPRRRGFLDCL